MAKTFLFSFKINQCTHWSNVQVCIELCMENKTAKCNQKITKKEKKLLIMTIVLVVIRVFIHHPNRWTQDQIYMQGPRVTSLAWVTNHEWVLYPFLKFLFKLFFTEKYLFYLSCTYYVISCIFIKHVVASTYEEIKNFPFRLLVEVFLSFLGLTTGIIYF